MNHLATSKEDILAASRELIKENGWTALSIRAVASRCSVSAGTIYNYYESKADLDSTTKQNGRHSLSMEKLDRQRGGAGCLLRHWHHRPDRQRQGKAGGGRGAEPGRCAGCHRQRKAQQREKRPLLCRRCHPVDHRSGGCRAEGRCHFHGPAPYASHVRCP